MVTPQSSSSTSAAACRGSFGVALRVRPAAVNVASLARHRTAARLMRMGVSGLFSFQRASVSRACAVFSGSRWAMPSAHRRELPLCCGALGLELLGDVGCLLSKLRTLLVGTGNAGVVRRLWGAAEESARRVTYE